MLLTRASEYALLSLDIIRTAKSPIGVEYLANELNIPKSFLAKILQNLAKEDILVSKKGAKGGFVLSKPVNEISLYKVIVAAEGKAPAVFDCVQYADTCPNGAMGMCAISPFLATFQGKINSFLKELSLGDIFEA